MKIPLMYKSKKIILIIIGALALVCGTKAVLAQNSPAGQESLYIPLIGITSVPDPLALPKGPADVTYHYAVKNFLPEFPLANIQVVDDQCSEIKFVEGDDNDNSWLDYNETWRYTCTVRLSETTQSVATAIGITNNIATTHKAYTTVIVGSNNPAPLVSIVNITKVAYPLSLPAEGGDITFTYKVNNPGIVPLSNVSVTDNKCSAMSGKLGDLNANNLLDTDEVWIYTCTMNLKQTTTNTATVKAFANGLMALAETTITVIVVSPSLPDVGEIPGFQAELPSAPAFPNTGISYNFLIFFWAILSGILAGLTTFWLLKISKKNKK